MKFLRMTTTSQNVRMKWRIGNACSIFLDSWTALCHPYLATQLYRVRSYSCKLCLHDCDHGFDDLLLPSQHLDVCRAVSSEVEYHFYSKNHFNISSVDLGRLSGFFSLKPIPYPGFLLFLSASISALVPQTQKSSDHEAVSFMIPMRTRSRALAYRSRRGYSNKQ